MKISKPMRLLYNKWQAGNSWPQRLENIEITGVRGWGGERVDFPFPIVAICGENGSGKSTILQAAASVYQSDDDKTPWFASDFFPDTAWDQVNNATIKFTVRLGKSSIPGSVRKPTDRWRGNPDRPKRHVEYIDLSRIQPVSTRTGYLRLAKPTVKEVGNQPFDHALVARLSDIMGKTYTNGKMSVTDADDTRRVPVVSVSGKDISGFHLGAGEFTITELLQKSPQKNSLVLIDEIETSLHPRAQRRLMRDLAELCRALELQIVLTTHSPYVLGELPPLARGYIMSGTSQKQVVFGVSPDFAMTQMDEESHPECDIYVEDERAKAMLLEILVRFAPAAIDRIQIIPFGTASVGKALGQMVKQKKFPRPSLVFLDGDQDECDGCLLLPGGDAPERVVFEALKARAWVLLDSKTGRDFSILSDACNKAMAAADHHEWLPAVANKVILGTDTLWQAMCSEWAANCFRMEDTIKIIKPIEELFAGI